MGDDRDERSSATGEGGQNAGSLKTHVDGTGSGFLMKQGAHSYL